MKSTRGSSYGLRINFISYLVLSFVTFVTGNVIKNSFIITLKSGVDQASFSAHTSWVAEIHSASAVTTTQNLVGLQRVFDVAGFKGYSGAFDSATIELIKRNKLVRTPLVFADDALPNKL